MKKTVELFAGTESFSNVARSLGHETITIELDPKFHPTHCVDILTMKDTMIPFGTHILWASPPCQGFSVAAIGKNWTGGYRGYQPKSDSARLSIALAKRTLELIERRHPQWWFIENPRGLLRKMPFMEELTESIDVKRNNKFGIVTRHTVTYCQYGDTRMKPTDIWTNAWWWSPRASCKNGDKCHEAAPRGSRTGTQGIKGEMNRSRIPAALFEEIFEQLKTKDEN